MKLTNQIRDKICDALVDRALNKKRSKLAKDRSLLGIKILRTHSIKREHIEIIDSLPEGLLETSSHIKVVFANQYTTLDLLDKFRVPGYVESWQKFESGHPFTEKFMDLKKRGEDIVDEERTLRSQSMAILSSCSTDTQLWKVWPEVRSVAEKLMPEPEQKKYPLAIPGSLNSALGLPAEVVE